MNKVEAAREWICSHNDGDVLYVKDAFVSGVDWTIDKVCDWLESVNLDWYQIREGVFSRQLVEDFKKYMDK